MAEIQRLNLPLNNHATCSRPFAGNKGCRFFDRCKFRPIRDGQLEHLESRTREDFIRGNGAGPDFIGFTRYIASTGAVQGLIMPCSDWYESGNEDRAQQSMGASGTGDAFGPPKYAGGTVTERLRVEVHRIGPHSTELDKESAKTCPDCKKGECRLTEERKRVREIPRMRRPVESLSDAVYGNEIMQEMFDEMQKEFTTQSMEAIAHQSRPEIAKFDEAPKPAKGAGLEKLKS